MPWTVCAELEAREREQAFKDENPVCPVCKTRLVLRVAQRGPHPGSKFRGCPIHSRSKEVEFDLFEPNHTPIFLNQPDSPLSGSSAMLFMIQGGDYE